MMGQTILTIHEQFSITEFISFSFCHVLFDSTASKL